MYSLADIGLYDSDFVRFEESKIIFNNDVVFNIEDNTQCKNLLSFVSMGLESTNIETNRKPDDLKYTAHMFKEFSRITGVTPSKAKKIYNMAYDKFSYGNDKSIFVKYCFFGKYHKIDNELANKVRENMHLIKQCRADNIEHIAPICVAMSMNPSECKKVLGNGLWKDLCKNSFTRNCKIFKCLWSGSHGESARIVSSWKVALSVVNRLRSKNLTQSTVRSLLLSNIFGADHLNFVIRELNNKVLDKSNYVAPREFITLFRDTKRMCEAREIRFNPNLNLDDMQALHDQLMVDRNQIFRTFTVLLEYNPAPEFTPYFPFNMDYMKHKDIVKFSLDDFDAELLMDMQSLVEETQTMKHCIGKSTSYAEEMHDELYLAYSIKRNGERFATLGISRNKNQKYCWKYKDQNDVEGYPCTDDVVYTEWECDQLRAQYNHVVNHETVLKLVDNIMEGVKKWEKEK